MALILLDGKRWLYDHHLSAILGDLVACLYISSATPLPFKIPLVWHWWIGLYSSTIQIIFELSDVYSMALHTEKVGILNAYKPIHFSSSQNSSNGLPQLLEQLRTIFLQKARSGFSVSAAEENWLGGMSPQILISIYFYNFPQSMRNVRVGVRAKNFVFYFPHISIACHCN